MEVFMIVFCSILLRFKPPISLLHGKNRFVIVTKLGTTNKNFAAATKRFVDRTK